MKELRPGAHLVWFGSTSGEPSPLSIYDFIGHEGVTVHTYFSYAADRAEDAADLGTHLCLVQAGQLRLETSSRWRIAEAAQAVGQLAAGGTRGKILLTGDAPG